LEPGEIRRRTARTFDGASVDFDATRRRPWPSVKGIGSLQGKRVLDLGAGTGRYSRYFLESGASSVVAADVSAGMLMVLDRRRGKEQALFTVRCDATNLPFKDSAFDAVAFIATLHHVPEKEERKRALMEVGRVTSEGGVVLITVWAPRELPKGARPAVEGGGEKDIYVPWGKEGDRFYHLFSPDELRSLIEEAGLSIISIYHERISHRDQGVNLVAVASR
jgi:SAM-dependent methyltransferase